MLVRKIIMTNPDTKGVYSAPDNPDTSSQDIEVYCAWCKKYLHNIEGVHKEKYSVSHGICKECSDKVFNFDNK